MDRNNDATLEELCDLLEQQSGTRVSRATMGRITQNLNYSVKKKHCTLRRKKVKAFRKSESNFGEVYEIFP
jgi:transposase